MKAIASSRLKKTPDLNVVSLVNVRSAQTINNTKYPDDMQWAEEAQPKNGPKVGIQANELNEEPESWLLNILEAFASILPIEAMRQRNTLISTAGIDQIFFGGASAPETSGQNFF
jgi:hypothetical protein